MSNECEHKREIDFTMREGWRCTGCGAELSISEIPSAETITLSKRLDDLSQRTDKLEEDNKKLIGTIAQEALKDG